MTTFRAVLQFRKDGPAVIGQWEDDSTARKTYRRWIGLYGTNPAATVRLIEEINGVQHPLRTWTVAGEYVTEPGEQESGG
ncbi:hypothetical protein ACNPQM_37505 [Streptomyces sp. NPDC056231]|uniref:hypothetical protein n=1 Tax=Streptomyces sp. NPDC056231 TaxID=3345755 RepID=UPI003AB0CBE5